MRLCTCIGAMVCAFAVTMVSAQEAPTGGPVESKRKEKEALESLKGKIDGKIVWSTSRSNSKHDIWIMNADGTDKRQLTKGDNVDWFSRFSPDGQTVLFVRSKMGWVPEGDAEMHEKWDLWTIGIDGRNEKKVAENACWGNWRPSGDAIVFARGPKVVLKKLDSGDEEVLLDAEKVFKDKTYAQQPELSPNGKLLAITLRGSTRETGIYNLEKKVWNQTGGGCQINWFPSGTRVLRMNEGVGNGGTEVLAFDVNPDGSPAVKIKGLRVPKEIKFMDLPGRRSHEYFPKMDPTGKWMVWCATQYGHEHDIYDYEIFIWDISTDKEEDWVRLTFHDGNDRWPDIYIAGAESAAPSAPAETEAVEDAGGDDGSDDDAEDEGDDGDDGDDDD